MGWKGLTAFPLCSRRVLFYWRHKMVYKKGSESHAWKGGRYICKQGYIKVYAPDHPRAIGLYTFGHILVVEKRIGRYLKPQERVHHINGIKNDNRDENLLFLPNESSHQKIHNPKGRVIKTNKIFSEKPCRVCKKIFKPSRKRQFYCFVRCRQRYWNEYTRRAAQYKKLEGK